MTETIKRVKMCQLHKVNKHLHVFTQPNTQSPQAHFTAHTYLHVADLAGNCDSVRDSMNLFLQDRKWVRN